MGFSNLKEYKVEFFQGIVEERKKGGIYKNWEDLIDRTINYWERIENNSFEAWAKSGLFRSLGIDISNLLNSQEAIFRYLSIRKKLALTNNKLPFLDLPKNLEADKITTNQGEFDSLGLYISYFSR